MLHGRHCSLLRVAPGWPSLTKGSSTRRCSSHAQQGGAPLLATIPCFRRAAAIERFITSSEAFISEGAEAQDGWVAPSSFQAPATPAELPSLADEAPAGDDAIPDIDDVADDDEDDEAAAPAQPYLRAEEGEEDIVRSRTYDLYITYDKFYQVPRFWLVGYDEGNQPLSKEQVMEDVSEDHARKTITMDPHPHLGLPAASIHPCRHAQTMKKLADTKEAGGTPFRVDHYLILFLKFIASVVPTIEYAGEEEGL